MKKQILCLILAVMMVMTMLPTTALAYVGAMQHPGVVTAGVETVQGVNLYYLKNDYIGFYINQDGNMITLPSQMSAFDASKINFTEKNVFYKQYPVDVYKEIWETDYSKAFEAQVISVKIDNTDSNNPKLIQTLQLPFNNLKVEVVYEIVKLDNGAHDTLIFAAIIGKDIGDNGKTWGIEARAKLLEWENASNYRVSWVTAHDKFGSVAHNIEPNIRINRHHIVGDNSLFYSARLNPGGGYMSAENVNEVYTDSFAYANQFVAFQDYIRGASWLDNSFRLDRGIEGHLKDDLAHYGNEMKYDGNLYVVHDKLSSDGVSRALWGFRDLHSSTQGWNPPPDPVFIPATPRCVGIIKTDSGLIAKSGADQAALKKEFGANLITIFNGDFDENQNGDFVFKSGSLQLAASLTASWSQNTEGIVISKDGKINASGVGLSTPTFKFYSPQNGSSDTSLVFSFEDDNLKIDIQAANNSALLHIDIPGSTCIIDSVTATNSGGVIFTGEMSVSTPFFDALNIEMKRLGMEMNNGAFIINGVEASGSIDISQILGMKAAGVTGEINTFPETERYKFEMELDVYGMFEAEAELELKPIQNGALIPNTLKLKAASGVGGIPLVPPVVVAELIGLGGGFSGLADSIKGDFIVMPPVKLSLTGKLSVVKVFEGWGEVTVGPGYYSAAIKDATVLDMDILEEFSWYKELSGGTLNYNGKTYTGLKVGGGMNIELALTKDLPFIKAGGRINAYAFAGIDDILKPKNIYVVMDASGKLFGKIQIPANKWFLKKDLVFAEKEIDFVLGGQTITNFPSISGNPDFKELMNRVGDSAKVAFEDISLYGGASYTGRFFGFPFRIYYIFKDKTPILKIGSWLGSGFDPFDPRPNNFNATNTSSLINDETGEQIGIMVLGDNMTILASSTFTGSDKLSLITPSSVEQNDAKDKGVTITELSGSNYSVDIDNSAPDTQYLAFMLKPKSADINDFVNTISIKKGSESITLIDAEYDEKGQIINENEANMIIGGDQLTLKLPSSGNYTISSDNADFDIACIYASPFASFYNMSLSDNNLNGSVKDMENGTEYILRTYLGSKSGSTDYLLSQSNVTTGSSISGTLELSGTVAPTGNYYVTTLLLEKHNENFDGDNIIDTDEFAYITTDTYKFNDTVLYTNTMQPETPFMVELKSIGSEMMQVGWRSISSDVDGYNIRLYQQEKGEYVPTGLVYQLKASDLTAESYGSYKYDMAITVGDIKNRLESDKNYKIGITTFKYLVDENNDGINDSLPIESTEIQGNEIFLPKATYPVLSYARSFSGDGMKIYPVSGSTEIEMSSDVEANIVVTRMDTNTVFFNGNELSQIYFRTPDDFTGALNLKIVATDAEGDITVDYIGLRLSDVPPPIALDSELFKANYNDGNFTVTGISESGTSVTALILSSSEDVLLDEFTVNADANGIFKFTGKLNSNASSPVTGAHLELIAENAAGTTSNAFAQIVRADKDDTIHYDDNDSTSNNDMLIPTEKQPDMPTTAKMSITGTVKDGVLSATITNQMVKDAIKAAQDAAKKLGKEIDGIALDFDIIGNSSYTNLAVKLDADVIKLLKEAGVKYIKIGSAVIDITIDTEAISEINKQSSGAVTVSANLQTKLSTEAKALIGSRPVFDITIAHHSNGKAENITNFGKGTLALSIKYKAADNETTDALTGVYVDKNGKPHILTNSNYVNGRLVFSRNSLSTYGVGYINPSPVFTDTAMHWAKDNIDFVASRKIINGTSANTFTPNKAITRADFLIMLGRLSGANVDDNKSSSFVDVKDTDPYMPYIEWAVKNKIVSGYGNGKFGPKDFITREQMSVMMFNYTNATAYKLPNSIAELTFSDSVKVSTYAKDSVKAIQEAGIIQGKGNNTFDPQGNATRAEAATIIRRFIELVIDEGSARGWVQNDSGQWQYISENGKATTGWLTNTETSNKYYFDDKGVMISAKWLQIEDKWYYFYTDGSLARNTKLEGYEVDENGVRK
jgi:hypothetical protein